MVGRWWKRLVFTKIAKLANFWAKRPEAVCNFPENSSSSLREGFSKQFAYLHCWLQLSIVLIALLYHAPSFAQYSHFSVESLFPIQKRKKIRNKIRWVLFFLNHSKQHWREELLSEKIFDRQTLLYLLDSG